MPTISSRLSIPLLLLIIVALAIPLTARAAAVLPGAEDCAWYQMIPLPGLMSCPDRNRANGFTGDGTMTLVQYAIQTSSPAPATAPAPPVAPAAAPATAQTSAPPLPANEAIQQYRAGERASYNNNPLPPANAIQQYRAQERALYNVTPSANVEPKDNWDLQGKTPSTRALTPLEKYQAQFTLNDGEFQRIATSCGNDDLGMGKERCMNYMIGLYRGGNPLSNDVLKVQTYIQSQSSVPQPITGAAQTVQQKLDACNAWTDEYGNETQNSTLCKNGVLDSARTSAPETTRVPDAFSSRNLQSELDFCDTYYGSGSTASNNCKEPILRKMGISESAQSPTPGYYGQPAPVEDYSRLAPAEDIARSQPCAIRASNGECLDESTGGLRCYSWIASWLPACENYKSTPTLVSDDRGSVTTLYQPQQFPAPVEERQASLPRPYTREEEDALSRIAITAEDTRFTPSEASSGEATGWLLSTQNFFSNIFGGDKAETAPAYEIYDSERAYPDNRYYGAPINDVNETDIVNPDIWQNEAVPYGYPPAGIPVVTGTELPPSVEPASVDYGVTPTDDDDYWNSSENIDSGDQYIINQEPVDQNFGDDGSYLLEDVGTTDTDNQGFWGSAWETVQNMWSVDDVDDEASIKPTRQFSMAVPFSDKMFEQSLAASAFGAFLTSPQK